MKKVIAIANQKGGVGKTTLAFNLTSIFSQDMRTLAIDFDFQSALTIHTGIQPESLNKNIYHVLIDNVPINEIILRNPNNKKFDLAPSGIELSAAEIQLMSKIGRENVLKKALKKISNDYEIIIIDTPPSLGILTVNALTAADIVLIPVETRFLGLRGLKILLDAIREIQENTNPNLTIAGVIPTFTEHTIHSKQILEILREQFPELKILPKIKKTVKFQEASVVFKPIFEYSQDFEIKETFNKIKKEVLKCLKENQSRTI